MLCVLVLCQQTNVMAFLAFVSQLVNMSGEGGYVRVGRRHSRPEQGVTLHQLKIYEHRFLLYNLQSKFSIMLAIFYP